MGIEFATGSELLNTTPRKLPQNKPSNDIPLKTLETGGNNEESSSQQDVAPASEKSSNWIPFAKRCDSFLPNASSAFDASAFKTALEGYMVVQRQNNSNFLETKQTWIDTLKAKANDLSDLSKKQDLQICLKDAAEDLTSWCFGRETAGSKMLNAWLEKLNEDPALKANAPKQEFHYRALMGARI